MKFSFSPKFRQSFYGQLLRELGDEIETYRIISGCNITEMMSALNISYPILKKCLVENQYTYSIISQYSSIYARNSVQILEP